MFIILVAGIHGVGKTYYCQNYASRYEIIYKSSGEIIKNYLSENSHTDMTILDKLVSNIDQNQEIILSEIQKIKDIHPNKNLLLDGHFTLLNTRQHIKNIPLMFYKRMGIGAVILLERDIKALQTLYYTNDNILVEEFIKKERNRAIEITNELDIPLIQLNSPTKERFNLEVNKLFKLKHH